MSKTILIDTLERHDFSRAEADTLVSGLTAEAVEATEPKTARTIAGLYGGMIATGLAVIGLTATLTTIVTGAKTEAFATGLRSEFTGLRESVAAQIAKEAADIQTRFAQVDARFNQIDAHLDRSDARSAAVETRLSAVDAKLDAKFGALDSKIDRLTDAVSALAKPTR